MASRLALLDETETIIDETPVGREYALEAFVEGVLGAVPNLGTALNALYAQALLATLNAPTVRALVSDVTEGRLNVEIVRQANTGPAAGFVLALTIHYFQRFADAPRREPILEALDAALAASTAPATLSIREQALVALRTLLETTLGFSIDRNANRPTQAVAATTLLDGDQEPNHDCCDVTFYDIEFAVELFAPNSDEAALATRAEAVLTALRLADRLGGLAVDTLTITLDPETLRESYTGPALGIRIVGTIRIATVANDPLTLAA